MGLDLVVVNVQHKLGHHLLGVRKHLKNKQHQEMINMFDECETKPSTKRVVYLAACA